MADLIVKNQNDIWDKILVKELIWAIRITIRFSL